MPQQNVYDNDAFFESFRSSRDDDVNFNDCIETPILLGMLPDLCGVAEERRIRGQEEVADPACTAFARMRGGDAEGQDGAQELADHAVTVALVIAVAVAALQAATIETRDIPPITPTVPVLVALAIATPARAPMSAGSVLTEARFGA